MTSNQKVKELGRLRYVEPTNFFQRQEGMLSDSINFPYEDYCMAVDLTIKQSNRYSCGWWEESNDVKEITYSSRNGSISFLGGTKYNEEEGYLTTNYTDISMTNPEANTAECLGINSISITYDSWWYPQVTIKFIDVRGATVMLPAEKGYYNNQEMGVASSIYKSLFTFPYPMFILKVKGFYGKGVTYHLALHNAVYEFDANTGDFVITASFIGYRFGVYTDIPISFISCAPFMEGGKEYWDSKIASGVFKFRDANGTPAVDMCTIPELRLKLAQAANNQEAISAAAEEQEILDVGNEQMQTLMGLYDSFPFKNWKNIMGTDFPNTKYCFKLFKDEIELDNFFKEVTEYLTAVKLYDEKYDGTNLMDMMSVLKTNSGTTGEYVEKSPYLMRFIPKIMETPSYSALDNVLLQTPSYQYSFVFYSPKDDPLSTYGYSFTNPFDTITLKQIFGKIPNSNGVYNKVIKQNSNDSDLIHKWIDTERNGNNYFLVMAYELSDAFNMTLFSEYVNDENTAVTEKANEKRQEYREKSAIAIEKAVGFRPSIRNIYELVFAHIDTFVHAFYASTKKIKNQLEGDRTKREKSRYYIKDGYTDTENVKIKSSNGSITDNANARSKYLPPYAAYYTDNVSGVAKGKVLTWLEELPNGESLEEVNFVRDLTSGAESYFKRFKEIENIIEQMNASGDTKVDVSHSDTDTPSFDVTHFVPVTPFDFAFKGKYENPYLGVKRKLNESAEVIEAEILTILALRACQYLSFTNVDNVENSEVFGKIEAINLFKAIGDVFEGGYFSFLKKYASVLKEGDDKEKDENGDTETDRKAIEYDNLKENFIKEISDSSYEGVISKQLKLDSTAFGSTLFKADGETLRYNYSKLSKYNGVKDVGGFDNSYYCFYPYHINGISDMQKNYCEDKPYNKQIFLPDVLNYGIYKKPDSEVTSFVIFNSRDYIENIYKAFENEINSSTSYVSTSESGHVYGNRTTSDYNDLEGKDTSLPEYKNNFITGGFSEKQYYGALVANSEGILYIKDIPRLILSGTVEEQNTYNIKYSTLDYTFDEEKPTSLFSNSVYNEQGDNYKAKAYLFLMAAPLIVNESMFGMLKLGYNGKALKAVLLREGAFYWYLNNNGQGVKWPEIAYKLDANGKKILQTKIEKGNALLNFIPLANSAKKWNDHIETIEVKNYSYFKVNAGVACNDVPNKVSPSRVKVLTKYFEDWAEGAFKDNEARLRNINLYSKSFNETGEKIIEEFSNSDLPYWYKFCNAEVLINNNEEVNGVAVKNKTDALTDERSYDNGLDIAFLLATETEASKELRELEKFLRDLFFGVCTTIEVHYKHQVSMSDTGIDVLNMWKNFPKKNTDMINEATRLGAIKAKFRNVMAGFIKQLYLTYYVPITDYNDNRTKFYEEVATAVKLNPFKNTDLKLSTYMTLKSLYDKWLCFPPFGAEKTWTLTRSSNSKSEFDNFIYVDSLYNEIGDKLLVNLSKVSDWFSSMIPSSNINTTDGIMQYTGRSVIEFLTEVAQSCGGNLFAIPQKFALTSAESVKDMFTPMPLYSDWDEDSTGYVFMYTYQPSQHLGDASTSNIDMNGWSSEGDGIDLTNDEIVGSVLCDGSGSYNIPAFGVTYAKQNQSIFKNIQMTTASMSVTEASISATFDVAGKMSQSPRETVVFGQDLYRIYSNYSYNCSVETMGNMQIMPMMYFQLNNVPFWRGAYQIIKVTHNITAGNMTTSFEGVRINRHAIPLADGTLIVECVPASEEGGSSGGGGSYNGEYGEGNVSTSDFTWLHPDVNVSTIIDTSKTPSRSDSRNHKDGMKNLGDHPGGARSTSKYWGSFSNKEMGLPDDAVISETNPIICLMPAHFPHDKTKGWYKEKWDTSYIGSTEQTGENKWSAEVIGLIYKGLKEKKYNVVSPRVKCNSDGTISFGDDYAKEGRGTAAYHLVEHFGSRKVISIMPHWNGGGNRAWLALMRGPNETTRFDSVKLMECICAAAYEFGKTVTADNAASLGVPINDGKPAVSNNKLEYFVCHYMNGEADDPGCLPNCAAACTENWFADWPKANSSTRGRDEWLGTDKGRTTVANIHIAGISTYIETLKKGGFTSTGSGTGSGNGNTSYEAKVKQINENYRKAGGNTDFYIDISTIPGCSDIIIDMKYATADNMLGKNFYGDLNKAYIYYGLVDSITKVHQYLKKLGYKLKIWDALRPNEAQKLGHKASNLFAKSIKTVGVDGSRHIYGYAIDCTIVDKDGKELDMGTGMDSWIPESGWTGCDNRGNVNASLTGGTNGMARNINGDGTVTASGIKNHIDSYYTAFGFTVERKNKVAENRQLLFNAMTCEGSKFKAISNEWWHYQLNDKRHKNPLM
jgi:D-alanyl-D-alanine dipeptidase